jgi:hypothetical protein
MIFEQESAGQQPDSLPSAGLTGLFSIVAHFLKITYVCFISEWPAGDI